MNTLYRNYRSFTAAAMAAVVVVGLTGLTLDQGHAGALPRGVVEIGELKTQMVGDLAVAVLPAVEVTARRDYQLADIEATEVAGRRG